MRYVYTRARRCSSPSFSAIASASCDSTSTRSSWPSCRSGGRRSRRRSTACSTVFLLSGRCCTATSACSKSITASRLAAHRVVGQPLHLLGQAVGVQVLDGRRDARMQAAPPLLQERAVGDVVRERVLERVLHAREQADLVDELRGLELGEVAAEHVLRQVGDRVQEGQRHVGADDGGSLQEALGLGGQPVDACGEHGLHGGRHLDGVDLAREAKAAAIARERLGLDERPHALLEEERIALGAPDEELLERSEPRIVAEKRMKQLLRARRGERVHPELGVVGPAAPAMVVLGAIAHEDEDARGGQALNQAVEECLRLRVDPVQALEDEEQRLLAALAEEEVLHGVERALTALGRVLVLPLLVLGGKIEELKEGGQRRAQALVEREELSRHLLADAALGVAL